jgi:hypothetical protein
VILLVDDPADCEFYPEMEVYNAALNVVDLDRDIEEEEFETAEDECEPAVKPKVAKGVLKSVPSIGGMEDIAEEEMLYRGFAPSNRPPSARRVRKTSSVYQDHIDDESPDTVRACLRYTSLGLKVTRWANYMLGCLRYTSFVLEVTVGELYFGLSPIHLFGSYGHTVGELYVGLSPIHLFCS